jgi:hypothetical protein
MSRKHENIEPKFWHFRKNLVNGIIPHKISAWLRMEYMRKWILLQNSMFCRILAHEGADDY